MRLHLSDRFRDQGSAARSKRSRRSVAKCKWCGEEHWRGSCGGEKKKHTVEQQVDHSVVRIAVHAIDCVSFRETGDAQEFFHEPSERRVGGGNCGMTVVQLNIL